VVAGNGREPSAGSCRTWMPGGEGRAGRDGRANLALARTWLVSVVAACSTMACLWPEPPDYQEPEQTPPFLWGPYPATSEVQSVTSGQEFAIVVNLRSEDAGEDLWAFLYLNYLIGGLQPYDSLRRKQVPAGSLSEERTIDMPSWTVPDRPTPGTCEQLTLIVSHQSNFDDSFLPINDNDVATLTWWLDINGTEQTAAECGGATP
jgi:hypothetical protein